MAYHYYGQAVFGDEVTRDHWFDKWVDYIDGVLEVVPMPDDNWAEGLEKQTHADGGDFAGPAFSISISVPDVEYLTNDVPPQQGRAEVLRSEMFNIPVISGGFGEDYYDETQQAAK